MADLHKLLKEGALLAHGKAPLPDVDPAEKIELIKREHLDWGHLRRADATPDDMEAMRQDVLEGAYRLLELAGSIETTARMAA